MLHPSVCSVEIINNKAFYMTCIIEVLLLLTLFYFIQFILFYYIPSYPIPFHSILHHSIPLHSIPFYSILVATRQHELQTLKFFPLQSFPLVFL
jgi:hypothetical protein